MSTQYARQTAIPCTIAEIKSGEWIQNDGLVPSGIKISRGTISRVSVIGVLVDKGENAFSLDDGTSITRVRSFDTPPTPIRASIGDLVVVIGRPREYNNERFLVLEICKRLRNPMWVQYRKHELELMPQNATINQILPTPTEVSFSTPTAPSVKTHHVEVPLTTNKNPFELLMGKIRELDSGNGASTQEVLSHINIEDAENYIRTLIEEGEIFEPRPGKIKVLE